MIDYFKVDFATGRINPVKGKLYGKEEIIIGNSRYKVASNIRDKHASYHVSYYRAKDTLLDYLKSKHEKLAAEIRDIEEQLEFAKYNY